MYDDAGQICLAGTRLLVEASCRDAFVERFTEVTSQHVLGDSREPSTTVSPMIHPEHLARVKGFVDRSIAAGDHLVFGGATLSENGLWFEPTLIEPHANDAEIVQHEVFGPVLTLQTFTSEEEAIKLANSTPYGLSAMAFTSDQNKADRFANGVRAGTIWVNCFLVRDLTAPFGGAGISGIGREGGDYALDFYSEVKTYQVKEDTTHG
jgi:betaine-aldehyde dehydrogenase/5-carboxymethyl-2-hydroxymuconic-semialdehyde dehydrogenase